MSLCPGLSTDTSTFNTLLEADRNPFTTNKTMKNVKNSFTIFEGRVVNVYTSFVFYLSFLL